MNPSRFFSTALPIFCLVLFPSLAFSEEPKWYPFFTKLTGFVNGKGVTVIPPKFEAAGDFWEGLAWVSQNLKYGFIDEKGSVVIEPQYDAVERFENGAAKVERNGKFGLVDKTGKEILPLRYDDCRHFEDGMVAVRSGSQWGFVDGTGEEKVALGYEQVQDYSDGLAGVEVKGKWGYIDKKGRMVLQPQYAAVCPFSEGKAFVNLDQANTDYSLIDVQGKIEPSITMYIDNQPRLHNGYAIFTRCSGAPAMCSHGIIDRKGQLVYQVNIQYKPPVEFNPDQTPVTEISVDELTSAGKSPRAILDSLLPKYIEPHRAFKKVRSAKKIRFFDQDGKIVSDQEYEGDSCDRIGRNDFWIKNGKRIILIENGHSVPLTIDTSHMTLDTSFGEGLVSFRMTVKTPLFGTTDDTDMPVTVEKRGFFDKTGKMVIGPEYDDLWHLSEGLAPFRIGSKIGYVRSDGVVAIPPHLQGYQMYEFSEGLAPFQAGGKCGYINAKGETVVSPIYNSPSPFRDGFALVKTDDPMVDKTIDPHGKVIATFPNYYLHEFRDGLASAYVREKKKSGYINKKGEWVIEPVFSWANDFSEGLAFVKIKGSGVEKCGFIDEKGTFRFPPYEGHLWSDGFKDGLAIVSGPNGSFVIDKTGKKILESNNRSEKFSFTLDGLIALSNQSGMTKYFDSKAKLLFANCYSEY